MNYPDDAYPSSKTMIKALLVVTLLSLSFGSIYAVDSEAEDEQIEWQILTKLNFSSQIRTHPNILLFITVPCKFFSFLDCMCICFVYIYVLEKGSFELIVWVFFFGWRGWIKLLAYLVYILA